MTNNIFFQRIKNILLFYERLDMHLKTGAPMSKILDDVALLISVAKGVPLDKALKLVQTFVPKLEEIMKFIFHKDHPLPHIQTDNKTLLDAKDSLCLSH